MADTLPRAFVATARRMWGSFCMADSTGRRLTFGRALVGSLILARWVRRHTEGETNLGLLLPASVGGALANVATSLAGKVPVNLNFTAGADGMAYAVERCRIRTILTSRAFLEKASLAAPPVDRLVYLEDVLQQTGALERLTTLAKARVLPAETLIRQYGGPAPLEATADSVATIIFSSGSTGVPKGVMLSHRNILSNIESVTRAFVMNPDDTLIGMLPYFHALGFMGTIWYPLTHGFGVVYHPNPMDAKTIGELCERYRVTFLISTPTFAGGYIRKCRPEQFAHLKYALVGAEKLREAVATAFREKFGVDLLEGYGCTEMSPVVSANVPDIEGRARHAGIRANSVGRPLPGVEAQIVDLETGEGPLVDRDGVLLVRGPNLMLGYLDDPDRTARAVRDGWYVTGDIARIDADGFLHITDRLSRFSKIGGEMVPHIKIEDSIAAHLSDQCASVVTAVPDESRGERLVAFYTDPGITPAALWDRLARSTLPKLWIPKREDLHQVETLPTLGSGKVDLRAVRQLALDRSSPDENATTKATTITKKSLHQS
jgi:acyl-[acyl-carrier-protein]-phospholipid O-acyltransferase/long-chain-fatty-acid--[acyl-carrier-protein] ligase